MGKELPVQSSPFLCLFRSLQLWSLLVSQRRETTSVGHSKNGGTMWGTQQGSMPAARCNKGEVRSQGEKHQAWDRERSMIHGLVSHSRFFGCLLSLAASGSRPCCVPHTVPPFLLCSALAVFLHCDHVEPNHNWPNEWLYIHRNRSQRYFVSTYKQSTIKVIYYLTFIQDDNAWDKGLDSIWWTKLICKQS